MARGLMNALQAALAGHSGGSAGYAKYQQQMKDEQARQQELERQRVRDALAQAQFDAQYSPEALARQERLTKEDRDWREAQERGRRDFESAEGEKQRKASLEAATRSAGAAAARDRAEREQTLADREAAGLAYLEEVRSDPQAARALQTLFANRPDLVRRPGLAGYELQQRNRGRLNEAVVRQQGGGDEEPPAGFLATRTTGAGEEPKLPPNQLPPGVSIEQYNTDAGYRRFINRQIAGGR
jgi:hypothetical protein